ncbi:MAG: TCR/Tet family MFS transporter [Proteobacteria bacterium]|nr:TCR/Tet family MFS transporter [Pseudomonadota bacterium]
MRNLRLIVVLAVVYIDMLGIGLAFPILPRLLQQMEHGSIAGASYLFGLLASLFALAQFVFAPLFGALSDRFGRRPLILVSLVGSALSYFLMAAVPDLGVLAVARLIAGVMGGSFATAAAYVADITPPEKRAESFGLIGAIFGLGFITGPLIGGVLGDIDLRLPFLAAGLLCVANLAFGFFALPESLQAENRKAFAWRNANPFGAFLEIGRYNSIYALLGIFVLATFANRASEVIWVLYTAYRFGWGPQEVGVSLAVMGAIFVIGQGWFTRVLIPRIGERNAILIGLSVSVAVSILYGAVDKGWQMYLVMPFAITGWTVAQPAVQGLMSRAVPANEQGLLQGAVASITNLSSIAGPLVWTGIFGYWVSASAPYQLPGAAFYVSAVIFLLALFLALLWSRRAASQPLVA